MIRKVIFILVCLVALSSCHWNGGKSSDSAELNIKVAEGDEEIIDIRLISNDEEVAKGYIKLAVGYLNFDEDGGAAEGLSDDLDFCYEEIVYKLDAYIKTQNQNSKIEERFANAISAIL